MTTATTPIIDRIRKLLELSKSSNEHEAATAAARAAELMRKHEIDQAVLAATAPGEQPVEDIVTDAIGTVEGKKVSWRVIVGMGVAAATGCKQWSAGGQMRAMGTRSAVGTWNYLCQYLTREVDRLADEAWMLKLDVGATSTRSWKNAFRVGAAAVIRMRLLEQAEASSRSKARDVHAAVVDAGQTMEGEVRALAIIDRNIARVDAAYEAFKKANNLRAVKIGATSSAGGLAAGRLAGASINLSGGGRGLPAPTKQIKE